MDEDIKELIKKYKHVFSSEQGKEVLEDLKRYCQYGRPSYLPKCNAKDAIWLDGNKAMCNYIIAKIEFDLDQEIQTQVEEIA